jgi:hypothetical protein
VTDSLAQFAPGRIDQPKVIHDHEFHAVTSDVQLGTGDQFLNLQAGPGVKADRKLYLWRKVTWNKELA